jgi:hypothetical protein
MSTYLPKILIKSVNHILPPGTACTFSDASVKKGNAGYDALVAALEGATVGDAGDASFRSEGSWGWRGSGPLALLGCGRGGCRGRSPARGWSVGGCSRQAIFKRQTWSCTIAQWGLLCRVEARSPRRRFAS